MRNSGFVFAAILSIALPVQAAPPASTPTPSEINAAINYVEANVKLPEGSRPLADYSRFYAVDPNGPSLAGMYNIDILKFPPGVYFVPITNLQWIMDGSCTTNIVVGYTFGKKDIFVGCRGHFAVPPYVGEAPPQVNSSAILATKRPY